MLSGVENPDPARHWWAAIVADLGPLRRSRDLRFLIAGRTVSAAGSGLTQVAVPYQVYQLTRSSLLVGLIGLVEFASYVALGLIGGALADAVDRRLMVRLSEAALAVCSLGLAANSSVGHSSVAALLGLTFLMAAFDAVQRPALTAMLPRIVGPSDLAGATTVSQLFSTMAYLAGPAVSGVLIAGTGVRTIYVLDVATFAFSLLMLWRMRAVPPPADAAGVSLARVAEGLRYARSRPDLIGTYAIDIAAMFFAMPESLFPQMSTHLGGARALGLLFTAPAVGGLLVNLSSGWAPRVAGKGAVLVFAAAGWGLAIVALGPARQLWVALVCLAAAGGMDSVSGLMRQCIWNQTIPDSLRGRLAGVEMLSYVSGPLLGNFEGGVAESLVGLRWAVSGGGIACVLAIVVVGAAVPALWRPTVTVEP